MKKLVYAGLGAGPLTTAFLWVVLILISVTRSFGQGCIISCPPNDPPTQVSLPYWCIDTLTYDEIPGIVLINCPGTITVQLFENGVPVSNVLTPDYIGHTYMVIITNVESGQSCMFMITVVDKQAPVVTCPVDVTLACNTNLQEYNGIDPADVQECSDYQVFFEDEPVFTGNCQGNIISLYLRTYIIVDAFNNADTCHQFISLVPGNLADVEFPPGLAGLDALDCSPPPDTSPGNTGYPSIDGNDILNGTFCNLTATYSDVTASICSGSYKIIRTWTVIDWCNNNASSTGTQIIEVLDKTKPVVHAPADFTMSTSEQNCTADVLVPPADVTEDCSNISDIRMTGTFGTIHSNGGVIPGLPVGTHRIIFIAENDCQLSGRDTVFVTVQDLNPPVPVCHQELAVPLNNLGFALIPASAFNAASYDNCGHVYFKVRRMTAPQEYDCANPGNPNNMFDDNIQFCCGDIAHNPIMVIFRVYDTPPIPGPVPDDYLQGHFNDCMSMVQVQDKLPPQIICPSDLTISCQFPFTEDNLGVFGTVALNENDRHPICLDDPGIPGNPGLQCLGLDGLATDNCSVSVESEADIDINNCGVGTIRRTFTATDDGGFTSTCVQTITVINFDPFTLADITWPQDFTTFSLCEIDQLNPENLDPPYNEPVLNDGPCDLVGATYHDDVFDFSNGSQACFKILRTWTVADWCQLNTQYGGIWTHIQVLKVMNNIAPVISQEDDITECSFDPQCGGVTLDLDAQATDDCTSPANLIWKYYIDLDNNQSFDYVSPESSGGTLAFTREFPIGLHRVLYTVRDRCGNITTEEQLIHIESCKPPSAKCIHGLSTNLMAMDTDGDGEADWGMVVMQAEMFDAGSSQACGNSFTLAFSADPLDVMRVFDCTDIGENEVELWAIDENGLTDFCVTTVDIQDNNHICPPPGLNGTISGNITVPGSGKLAGAMVYLDGSNQPGIPTSTDGYFVFPAMPFGGQYIVRPTRDSDPKNGVTTLDLLKIQKHLLGLETFTTPYEYIAADANNSESVTAIDIIQLRKLILGIIPELPNNRSWRFIDKAHVFPDPNNPWSTSWPETYSIIPFNTNMNEVNFDAVKVGDVNRTASLQAGNSVIRPRDDNRCRLAYQVSQQPDQDVYKVDLYLESAEKYQALQFSLDWDHRGYELMDWAPGSLLSAEDVHMPDDRNPKATLATYTVDNWPSGRQSLVTLWVKSISKVNAPFQLFLSPSPTSPIAYEQHQDEEIGIELSQDVNPGIHLWNIPDPFQDMTTIFMQSSRSEPAVLHIFDLTGKLVHSRDVLLDKGENEFIVHKSDLPQAGVYVYEIESNFQYSTNRMIIVN